MTLKSLDNNVNRHLKLTISAAAMEDSRGISAVLAQSFYEFPNFVAWLYPCLRFTINEDLRYRLRSPSPMHSCFVAKLATSEPDISNDLPIVGTIEIALRAPSLWSQTTQYPYISNLAIAPDFRRLGIGSRLLAQCEKTALDWGYQETRLHVLESNDPAKQLYCHNGYQISQIEPSWGGLWFDWSPRLLLKKQIQPIETQRIGSEISF